MALTSFRRINEAHEIKHRPQIYLIDLINAANELQILVTYYNRFMLLRIRLSFRIGPDRPRFLHLRNVNENHRIE